MAYLVLVRHGTSTYNAKGLWAGWDNPELNKQGKEDAKVAAEFLTDIHFDQVYISDLLRHKQTAEIILNILNQHDVQFIVNNALKERDYGDFTAKNKWEVEKQLGEEEFLKLRRSWDYPVPNGESLKQVYDREVPYYESTIKPELIAGKNILIAGSGNSLRALVKYFDNVSDEAIADIQIAPGEIYVYTINEQGEVTNKEIRNHHELTV